MGYTHYSQQTRDLTPQEWHDVRVFAETLFANSPVPLSGCSRFGEKPHAGADEIWLNGVGEDEHETFAVSRFGDSQFCKTARKPYDIVVTAILCFMESRFPDCFSASSDGGPDSWKAGQELAAKAARNLPIVIPADVISDRGANPDDYPPVTMAEGFAIAEVAPPRDYTQTAIF